LNFIALCRFINHCPWKAGEIQENSRPARGASGGQRR